MVRTLNLYTMQPHDAAIAAVVTEELRNRSGPGRELVEGEDDVAAVQDAIQQEALAAASPPPAPPLPPPLPAALLPLPTSEQRLEMNTLARALPHESTRLTDQLRVERSPVSRGKKAVVFAVQPVTPKEFLARPYHAFNRNRFLFSCADEDDGFAKNRGAGTSSK